MSRTRLHLDRARDLTLTLLLAAAAVVNFNALRGFHFEDAYLTFRYAANLAAGDGLVFNPGERVLGTSTPLLRGCSAPSPPWESTSLPAIVLFNRTGN